MGLRWCFRRLCGGQRQYTRALKDDELTQTIKGIVYKSTKRWWAYPNHKKDQAQREEALLDSFLGCVETYDGDRAWWKPVSGNGKWIHNGAEILNTHTHTPTCKPRLTRPAAVWASTWRSKSREQVLPWAIYFVYLSSSLNAVVPFTAALSSPGGGPVSSPSLAPVKIDPWPWKSC